MPITKQFCFSQATFINVLCFPYQFTHEMYMHKEILLDYFEMPYALFYSILSTSQKFYMQSYSFQLNRYKYSKYDTFSQ